MNFVFRNVRSYIRDISIVIVGIIITFAGSEVVSRQVKKKEIRAVVEFIKEELESNISNLEVFFANMEKDRRFFGYLLEDGGNISSIPLDTLKHYRNSIHYYEYFFIRAMLLSC